MLSNPEIFTTEEEENLAIGFFAGYAKTVALGISALTGVNSDRFGQVHTVLYSVFVGIFLIFFIMEKVSGTFSRIMDKVCCRCLHKDSGPGAFSNDLFCDIGSEAQRKEYAEAKATLTALKDKIRKEPHNEFLALRTYYMQRLELKIKSIRYHLLCGLSLANIKESELKDTKNQFWQLAKKENQAATREIFDERMTGLYSYDVLDSPAFIQAKKIERRIAMYDKKMRD